MLTGAAELGRLGSDLGSGVVADGAGLWDAAVAAWEQAGDPYAEAYVRFRRAEATLAHAGDRAAAAADLRVALGVADRLGAVPLGGRSSSSPDAPAWWACETDSSPIGPWIPVMSRLGDTVSRIARSKS